MNFGCSDFNQGRGRKKGEREGSEGQKQTSLIRMDLVWVPQATGSQDHQAAL